MEKIAKVVIEKATLQFDSQYSYVIPQTLLNSCQEGKRVIVPFGRGNIKKQGVILHIDNTENVDGLKPVLQVLDENPVLNGEMIALCEWMHNNTFCTYFDAIHTILPTGINYKIIETFSTVNEFCSELNEQETLIYNYVSKKGEVAKTKIINDFSLNDDLILVSLCTKGALVKNDSAHRNISDATEKMVHLCCEEGELPSKLTKQQNSVLSVLQELGDASLKEILYFTGVSASVVKTLEKNGIVATYEKEVFRIPDYNKNESPKEIVLNEEQQVAYNALAEKIDSNTACCELLYGVTGSGKTQVFLKLVDKVVESGKGVIVMVPEISLTPQTISLFAARYGNKIAVFHSAMSLGQRTDEWKRVKNGEAQVAIGTRSAVFAPFENLGLIIMDEEQEHTYKSEKSPRFHARNVAKFRANRHGAMLLLASATPSVESFCNAKLGKYGLHTLRHRYANAILPEVVTVDMQKEVLSGNSASISRTMYEEISKVLEAKKQAILLLNRRGYKTYISCPGCSWVATCPNCSISLTYHNANKRLMCHYCGYSAAIDKSCPMCGSEHLKFFGLGTQKLEEELQSYFPTSKILRLDADTTMSRDAFSGSLKCFADGEYDLMIGTQMVAKGLDFKNVTLVGVVGADQAMYSEDFRSFERTFSLLTQVIGRAGRGEFKGKAVIQTTSPDSELIKQAVKQDYEAFYNTEITTRKLMTYPPYCDMVIITASSTVREFANETVKEIFNNLKNGINGEFSDVKMVVLGPSAASIPKISNRYRFRMIIKTRNNAKFRELVRQAIQVKLKNDTSVSVDINPETII